MGPRGHGVLYRSLIQQQSDVVQLSGRSAQTLCQYFVCTKSVSSSDILESSRF